MNQHQCGGFSRSKLTEDIFLSLVHGVALLGRGANQEKGQWFSANDPLELGDKVKCKGEQAMSL